MAVLTVATISRTGVADNVVNATDTGDSFLNTGFEIIHIQNGGGTAITAHVAYTSTTDGQTVAQRDYPVAGSWAGIMVGPFPPQYFSDSNNMVSITYTGVAPGNTVVKIQVFKFVPG